MYGVVTRNPEELEWAEFDTGFYEVKDVTGRATEPVETGVNMISCFGDNATAEQDPSLVPVNEDGERATRERPYFDWDYICPTRDAYREGLLAWARSIKGPRTIFVTHGEERSAFAFADQIAEITGSRVCVPKMRRTVDLLDEGDLEECRAGTMSDMARFAR